MGKLVSVVIILLVLLFVFFPIVLNIQENLRLCEMYDGTDVKHEWSLWGGCYLETEGGYWIHFRDYQKMELSGELK